MRPATPIVLEFGLVLTAEGDGLQGRAEIRPELLVPSTDVLRASVLATWIDQVAGLMAARTIAPRVSVTLDLDLHLFRQPRGLEVVLAEGTVVKLGRSIVVLAVELLTEDRVPLGVGHASFVASPDATLTLAPLPEIIAAGAGGPVLSIPLAERARCVRRAGGSAELQVAPDALNASNTVNGGLLALVVEEAVLAAAEGATLATLALRYLRPVRVGPVVATATMLGPVARIDVRDAGADRRQAVLATATTS